MKNFTMEDLKRLSDIEDDLCISMYMPTEPGAATVDEQRIRFKNLLRKAEKEIQENGANKKMLYEMVEQGRRLLENDYFWRYQSSGLAVFLAAGTFLFYKLPVSFEEEFVAGKRFYVKPLIPLFMADGRFYVLALSQQEVRLFSCTRYNAMEIDLVDVPEGIAESLKYDSKQYQLQFHTGAAGGGGNRPAIFHGHGVSVDDNKDELLRYFQDVDRGLSDILPEQEVPLVLAGVEYLLPIFKEASSYRRVMKEVVRGNPETLRAEELHQKAWGIVRPELEKSQREDKQRYRDLAGKGYTAAGVQTVVPHAAYGRVDTLFIDIDARRPGSFDPDKNETAVFDEDSTDGEDLLDLAAVETIKHSGKVYALTKDQMPEEHAAAAAILRY
ncbi:MAG: hypothetical protein K9K88_15085 [Desulfobacterales bacterium]|nr:hypothetical protein [Desulfobacterales bacterium]